MISLVQQRCQFHAYREAVARCPECGRFFCRECVTEHEDRMICASCLRRIAATPASAPGVWRTMMRQVLALGAGLILAWCVFYAAGRWLAGLPGEFHEGTIWSNMMD